MKNLRTQLLTLICAFATLGTYVNLRAEAPAAFKVSELSFTRPAAWEWVPTSGMRKAQLKIKEGKDAGDVVFFFFGPGSGGSVQANLDRWIGQFEEPREKLNPKIEEKTVGKTKISYLTVEGTYKSGMPGQSATPMANFSLLGAIIEAEGGNVIIRLTGPKELARASQAEFRKMIEGALK